MLVVDGPSGSEGPFELRVSCGELVPGRIDLRVVGIDTAAVVEGCSGPDVAGTARVAVSSLGRARNGETPGCRPGLILADGRCRDRCSSLSQPFELESRIGRCGIWDSCADASR